VYNVNVRTHQCDRQHVVATSFLVFSELIISQTAYSAPNLVRTQTRHCT